MKTYVNTNTNTNGIANITKAVKTPKTTVELIKDINAQGVELEYLAVDGTKLGVLGYSSKQDRENALKFVQNIVDNSNNTGAALYNEIMMACMTGAAMTQEGIRAKDSEEIEIEGIPVLINYEKGTAYIGINTDLKEIANLNDLDCELPDAAIKALLIERSKNRVAEFKEEFAKICDINCGNYDNRDDCDEDDNYDDYDDYEDSDDYDDRGDCNDCGCIINRIYTR